MALTMALNNALSSLRTNQTALNVLSNNISNANTEGYSRQILALESQYVGNQGVGVRISDITRNIDLYLQRTSQTQYSIASESGVIDEYMKRAQILMGEPAADNSLNAYVDNFFSAFQDLADNPDRASLRENTLKTAQTLARQMSSLAYGLEQLRFEADLDLKRGITTVNELLVKLHDVNLAIGNADALGQTKVGLYDSRDNLVEKISEYLDIRVRYQKDGRAHVSAAGGVGLVDYQLHQLSYTPAQGVDSFIGDATLSTITSTAVDYKTLVPLAPPTVLVGEGNEGQAPDTTMKSGKILGLLRVRDQEIPEILNTLDTLAMTVREQVNKVHNNGAGFPPPEGFLGQVAVDPEEVRQWTGAAKIAVVDPNGEPLANPYPVNDPNSWERGSLRPVQLNFGFNSGEGDSGWHSNQTIVDEINAYYGAQLPKWELGNLSNIRMVSNIDNNPPSAAVSLDFDFENISDLGATVDILAATINGVPAATSPTTSYTVQPGESGRTGTEWGVAGNGIIGVNTVDITIQVTDANGIVETDTLRFLVDNTIATGIKNDRYVATTALGAVAYQTLPADPSAIMRASFEDADGNAVPTGEFGYIRLETFDPDHRIAIDEGTSQDYGQLFNTPPVEGTYKGFSHYFGFNNFFNENNNFTDGEAYLGNDTFKNSALNLSIRSDIEANSNYISTGRLVQTHTPSDDSIPYYSYELGPGGQLAAQAMADLGLSAVRFDQSGLLPTTDQTLSSFASSFLGAGAAVAEFAKQEYDNDNLLLTTYREKLDSIKGVNLDEEVGNTVIYQNAYAASARIITVVNEMFDALIGAT